MSRNQTKQSDHTAEAEGLAASLQELLEGLVAMEQVRHAVVAVERGDGSFCWVGAQGEANPDGTPMQADTAYWIASVTKLYIASAIWKLYEQGRIAVDERMATYLPAERISGLHRMSDGVDRTDEITLRHLLGHSSGLPDYLEERPEGGKSLFDQIFEQGDRSWSLDEAMEIVRDRLTPYFVPQPLHAEKKKIRYSDTNYQLLIAIIEAVTGQPLHAVFAEMFYQPLGLKQTFHPGNSPAEPVGPLATVWHEDDPLDIPLAMQSFRDLNSTIDDQLAFMRALVQDQVFEDPATLGLMMSDWNTFPFSLNPAPLSPKWPIAYGLGMMRLAMPRLFTPFRPIPPVVGHTGVSGSWLFYCEELDTFLAGTVDQMTAGAVPFRFIPRLVGVLAASFR